MSAWYQSKIAYRVQDDAGKWKTINESFLHDGVSFTDVEAQLFKMVEGRLTDFEVKSISQVKYEAVYEPHVGGDFYKVTVLTQGELDDKKTTTFHLVAADSVIDAEKRAEAYMKTWLDPHDIIAVVKSPILGVWHPVAEDWQNDFETRSDKLSADGHESGDVAQTTLFDKDGKAKTNDPTGSKSEFANTLQSAFDGVTA